MNVARVKDRQFRKAAWLYHAIPALLLLVVILHTLQPVALAADHETPAEISRWDFGYVPQKSEVSHVFYVRNTGSSPLTVTKIKAGCSCTSVSRIDRPIAPGDSAAITVTFKSGRYSGPVRKTTRVYTDSPERAVHHLRIAANVIKLDATAGDIHVEPSRFVWVVDATTSVYCEDTLRITNKGTDSLTVAVVYVPDVAIDSIVVPSRLAPQGQADIVLRPSEKLLTGDVSALSITMAFVGKDTTLVTVPIVTKR